MFREIVEILWATFEYCAEVVLQFCQPALTPSRQNHPVDVVCNVQPPQQQVGMQKCCDLNSRHCNFKTKPQPL